MIVDKPVENKTYSARQQSEYPIDLDHLRKQTLDDDRLFEEILALFATQCKQFRQNAADTKNSPQLTELAHQLKGCALSVGAWNLADLANLVEKGNRSSAVMAKLDQQISQLIEFIEQNGFNKL